MMQVKDFFALIVVRSADLLSATSIKKVIKLGQISCNNTPAFFNLGKKAINKKQGEKENTWFVLHCLLQHSRHFLRICDT